MRQHVDLFSNDNGGQGKNIHVPPATRRTGLTFISVGSTCGVAVLHLVHTDNVNVCPDEPFRIVLLCYVQSQEEKQKVPKIFFFFCHQLFFAKFPKGTFTPIALHFLFT